MILQTLRYHWRVQLAVACGVAVGTAVLTGALVVGDSMRWSLRQLTLERLGRIDEAAVAGQFFRAELADEVIAGRQKQGGAEAAAVILMQVSVGKAADDNPLRANQVNLIGCDERFWNMDPAAASGPRPQGLEVVLNRPLAERLEVEAGDSVTLSLPRPGTIPSESAFGRRDQPALPQPVTVKAILPAEGFGGRFALNPNQQLPFNAYVSLDWLQDRLKRPGRANALLIADRGQAAGAAGGWWQPKLEDYGIQVRTVTRRSGGEYLNITSDRMILEPGAESAILDRLRQCEQTAGAAVQPALTYLANTIACGGREIPYSTVTAIDFAQDSPLGPMLTPGGQPIGRLADDQIALNAWAADDLGAKPGDTIRLTYYEPESVHGQLRQHTAEFQLAAVVQLAGAARDPAFTPEVPGVTDRRTIQNWDLPFPLERARIRPQDEKYWNQYQATPKAFVSLAAGQRLWGSRFGRVTSIRVASGPGLTAEQLRECLTLDPARMGFVLQPVKQQGLAASVGTTPFEWLFMGFSMFIIASAAMLVALLFRLGIAGRASQIGILRAVGFSQRQVGRMLAVEGLAVAAAGSVVGVAAGIGYAALMLTGLQTWWLAAIVTPFLRLHVTPMGLVAGYVSGVVIAVLAIVWSARQVGRIAPRRLLAGEASEESRWIHTRPRYSAAAMWVLLAGAVAIGAAAVGLGQEAQAGAFFGAGSMVLAAALVAVWSRLIAGRTGAAVAAGRGNLLRLAVRNAARHPGRSTLTIGLVAAASFLIAAISAFRIDPTQSRPDRQSGNGGFALTAESAQPVYADLNSADGRADVGMSAADSKALADTLTIGLRMKPGDDASCLNLYRPQRPRVLGVPQRMIERGGFAWSGSLAATPEERANPWLLLNQDRGREQDGDGAGQGPTVPVVLDANTAMYSLQTGLGKTLEIDDGRGGKLRLKVAGLLSNSIFQGDLLIGEAAFLRHFPDQGGYRFFVIEAPQQEAAPVQNTLERALADYGLAVETTGHRLARFLAVQNTYLSTFQSLGGLGLVLGTFGLAAVQLRSVLERRRELALLRATGYRRRMLAWLVTLENGLLLVAGLAAGLAAALVAVLPHLISGRAALPWLSIAATLGLVLAIGLAAGLVAVRAAASAPLLAALREE